MEKRNKSTKRWWDRVAKFVSKLWSWIVNIDNWIEAFRPVFVAIFMAAITIYLIYDILGKVPTALHVNFVMLSATLGGLVFAGASLYNKEDIENRKRLMNVAKKFIIATFFFLIFFVFFIFIKDVNVALFSLDFYKNNLGYAIVFWLAALGIYGGSGFFAFALVEFIVALRKLK